MIDDRRTHVNDFHQLIGAIGLTAAVLLYEWLKPERGGMTISAMGYDYWLSAARTEGKVGKGVSVWLDRQTEYRFYPNAIPILIDELRVKISQGG